MEGTNPRQVRQSSRLPSPKTPHYIELGSAKNQAKIGLALSPLPHFPLITIRSNLELAAILFPLYYLPTYLTFTIQAILSFPSISKGIRGLPTHFIYCVIELLLPPSLFYFTFPLDYLSVVHGLSLIHI